ncbi:GNAT family N-acetyltransferase [Arthrobacter sp.]|uniref:GNAT family N-acetyltransferase n=1 Tax=Arthrobacter sp. TaxID=1667 RepID=UPI003A90DB94
MIADLALPRALDLPGEPWQLRRAVPDDVESLMALLAADPISASKGDGAQGVDRPRYVAALAGILADRNNDLLVLDDAAGQQVATFQLTRIPCLARRGSVRLQVEAVHVDADLRSAGIGTALMRWVIEVAAPATGAELIQLTSDAARGDAHRFYERLGFVGSHVGFKYTRGSSAGLPQSSGPEF